MSLGEIKPQQAPTDLEKFTRRSIRSRSGPWDGSRHKRQASPSRALDVYKRQVTDLACLLRGNIGVGSSQKITFEQELGYVHYYLDLQRERFGEKLSYSVEYEDEDLLRYLVPRLTIQPLVENAIVHGLEPRRGLGSVAVRLWEEMCIRDSSANGGGAGGDLQRRTVH